MGTPVELEHPSREDLSLTTVLFALSDPERLAIAAQLASGPMNMADCTLSAPYIPKSTRSHLMKVLRESGVIRNESAGRNRVLTLRREDLDARFPGVLDTILASAGTPELANQ